MTADDFFEGVPTISSGDASVTCGTTESHLVDVSRLSTSRWWYVCGREEARVDEPPPPPCVNDHVRTTTSSLLSLSPSLPLSLSPSPSPHNRTTTPTPPPHHPLFYLPPPLLPLSFPSFLSRAPFFLFRPFLPPACDGGYCRVLRPRTQRLEQVV